MENENELLFEVGGVKIFRGAIYIAKNKEDLSAPSGFIELGTTKLPSSGVDNSFPCNNIQTPGSPAGVWDTGFHEYSPCYRSLDKNQVKGNIELLQKNLVIPYGRMAGNENILDHTNDEFWSKKKFKISSDKVFNTEEPEDLLTLYFGLLTKELTPENQLGNTKYSDSAYVLLDKTKDVKRKDVRTSKLYKAVGLFEGMLVSDRRGIEAVLEYLKTPVATGITDDSLRTVVNEYLSEKTGQNLDLFLSAIEEYKTEDGRDKIEIFIKLKTALKRGNKVTKNTSGILFYGDTEIGPDLRGAAYNISKVKELESIKKELLFEENIVTNDDN